MARKKKAAAHTNPTRLSFKDVEIAFLQDGVDGVKKLLGKSSDARGLLSRAIEDLKAKGHKPATLEAFAGDAFPRRGRGRSEPRVGDEQTYKAQEIGHGGAFLRLPLRPIGVKKGAVLTVRFEAERIIVMRR